MKKFLVTLSLLLTFGLSTAGVTAQVDVSTPDIDDMAAGSYEIEGLQSAYERSFTVDFEAMLASPEVDFESLDLSAMMQLISIQGMTFDSEDNARAYLETTSSEFSSEMDAAETEMLDEEAEMLEQVEIVELEGFDVDGYRLTMDLQDMGAGASIIIFVDGNQVFMVMAMDSTVEAAESRADEVTQFVLDAEVETEEVTFSTDGTSTGGVFDRMPSVGDEIVGELTSVSDSELYIAATE